MNDVVVGLATGFAGAEALWSAEELHGLTVWNTGRWKRPLLGGVLALGLFKGRERRWWLGATLGVAAQLGVAALRRRQFSPQHFFAPGEQPAYQVEAVALARPDDQPPLPVVLWTPPAAQRVVLLVHGAGAHKAFYTWPLIEGLLAAGLAVCAVDVDGHGDNAAVLQYPDVIENPGVAVRWLRERFPWVGVIGHSQGGGIVARAVAEGMRVERLALVSVPILLAYHAGMARREWETLVHPSILALHRRGGSVALIQGWRTTTRQSIGTLDLIARLAVEQSLPMIDQPVLLCYGGRDLIAPPADGMRLRRLASAGSELVIVPRQTHLSLTLNRQAIQAIVSWFDPQMHTDRSWGTRTAPAPPQISKNQSPASPQSASSAFLVPRRIFGTILAKRGNI